MITIAMIGEVKRMRRNGETLDALPQLDAAINDACEKERFIVEVTVPPASGPRKPPR